MDKIKKEVTRRTALTACLSGFAVVGSAVTALGSAKMIKPWQWITKKDSIGNTDGTPLQFIPKTAKDPNPTKNEFKKYPRCPYCGMMRKMWSHTRHLIHYDNNLVDGTCSIHCTALSLAINMDLKPKAIYVGDTGVKSKVKPLITVDEATYLVGAKQPGTMTAQSKWAYGTTAQAEAARKKLGGEMVGFDKALTAAYLDMAKDTVAIRKKRAKKRKMDMA